jgi:molybdopterin/thiamine biosynthesis adenylyltransferase
LEILKNLPSALFGNLSPAEMTRYEKQLRLADWGLDAQEKLKTSRVFIAGAGGLVTAAAFSLVAAGVGHLRVVDARRVSLQDLGDQMLYRERDLNKPKVSVLQQRLHEANPFSEIEGLERKISEHNAVKIIQGADLLLVDLNEGETAAVLNRAAIKSQIPLILAWTQEMRGFIITLKPGQGLCLECTSLTERGCKSEAVMAPMRTIVGGLMALEALRILGGPGPVLLERLFGYDGDLCHCLEEPIKRKKECPVCNRQGQG